MAKVAKRNSSQIIRESRKVKLVEECNATTFLTESASEITVQTALNPDELKLLADTTNMATGVKHDIVHAYLTKVRSSEEIEILKEDMRNTLHYFQLKQECIKDACEDLSSLKDSSVEEPGTFLPTYCGKLNCVLTEASKHSQQFPVILPMAMKVQIANVVIVIVNVATVKLKIIDTHVCIS